MKGITTLAALPSGAGQAANLRPEVGSTKEEWTPRVFPGLLDAAKLGALGYQVNASGFIERIQKPAGEVTTMTYEEWCRLKPKGIVMVMGMPPAGDFNSLLKQDEHQGVTHDGETGQP